MAYNKTTLEETLRKELEKLGMNLKETRETCWNTGEKELKREPEDNVIIVNMAKKYSSNFIKGKRGYDYSMTYVIMGNNPEDESCGYNLNLRDIIDEKMDNGSTLRDIILERILSNHKNYQEQIEIIRRKDRMERKITIFYEKNKANVLHFGDYEEDLKIKSFYNIYCKEKRMSEKKLVRMITDYLRKQTKNP